VPAGVRGVERLLDGFEPGRHELFLDVVARPLERRRSGRPVTERHLLLQIFEGAGTVELRRGPLGRLSAEAADGENHTVTKPTKPLRPSRMTLRPITGASPAPRSRAARAEIDLPRADDLLIRVVEHLFPLRDPAGRCAGWRTAPGTCRREAHRLVDQPE
jgi:hypothetical protein